MHESWRDFNFLSISGILCRLSSFPISIIKIYRSLKRRKLLLDRGNPLDELHFHYFTSNKLLNYMESIGNILDYCLIEGTNSAFCCVSLPR